MYNLIYKLRVVFTQPILHLKSKQKKKHSPKVKKLTNTFNTLKCKKAYGFIVFTCK